MTKTIDITVAFVAPVGTPGTLHLLHERPINKTALLSIDMGCHGNAVCAPLTTIDMRRLVDGLMDAIDAIERYERLHGPAL